MKNYKIVSLSSDISNADGMSIVWAARLMGLEIKERVAGIDLMDNLVGVAYKKTNVFFLVLKNKLSQKLWITIKINIQVM